MAAVKGVRFLLLIYVVFMCFNGAYAPGLSYTPALSRATQSRDVLIKAYFNQGYTHRDIAMFLSVMHGISIGTEWVKKLVRRLGLRRRRNVYDEDYLKQVLDGIREELKGSGN